MHRPSAIFLRELVDMGFNEHAAAKALVHTGDVGVEHALNWLLEHAEDADLNEPLRLEVSQGEPSTSGGAAGYVLGVPSGLPVVENPDGGRLAAIFSGSEECKVVLVVAGRPVMSAGKVAAQCAHAALGLYRAMLRQRVAWLGSWEGSGEKMVVLAAGGSSEELGELEGAARALQLPCYLVRDAGRTEVAAGTATALAIGGVAESVDQVTGHLRTL